VPDDSGDGRESAIVEQRDRLRRVPLQVREGSRGDAPAVGFAPRRAATSIYLPDGVGRYDEQLKQLGVHRTGVGCLYAR
jgi:hypothetical protein